MIICVLCVSVHECCVLWVCMSIHECVLVYVSVHMLYVYSVCECTSVHCGCVYCMYVCT